MGLKLRFDRRSHDENLFRVSGGFGVGWATITSIALDHTLGATLWHRLLHLTPHLMLLFDIFSCMWPHTWYYSLTASPCVWPHNWRYALTSILALDHTLDATRWHYHTLDAKLWHVLLRWTAHLVLLFDCVSLRLTTQLALRFDINSCAWPHTWC